MSGHGQHDSETPHETHGDLQETTSDDFPADEPRSPGWLPLLGGALLLAGVFAFVALNSSNSSPDEQQPAAAQSPTPASVGNAEQPAHAPAHRPMPPLPGGAARPAIHPPAP